MRPAENASVARLRQMRASEKHEVPIVKADCRPLHLRCTVDRLKPPNEISNEVERFDIPCIGNGSQGRELNVPIVRPPAVLSRPLRRFVVSIERWTPRQVQVSTRSVIGQHQVCHAEPETADVCWDNSPESLPPRSDEGEIGGVAGNRHEHIIAYTQTTSEMRRVGHAPLFNARSAATS